MRLLASKSVIKGISIADFNIRAISIVGDANTIEGNFIGLTPSGTPISNTADGVVITSGGNNLIGGVSPAARNVISGNGGNGIEINGTDSGNLVQGNFIGTRPDGSTLAPNQGSGVFIHNTSDSTVGGPESGARNIISGNEQSGVRIEGASTTGNKVQGNYIGTNSAGTAALGNSLGACGSTTRTTTSSAGRRPEPAT